MPKRYKSENVFDAALDRLINLYREGHRVLVSFSAGKDSGVCVELCILAATMTDRLPVEVIMRDEEIMYPGTFEYAERIASRPEVKFYWHYACQPIVNVYNRKNPYFWVFDPLLKPDEWVRTPPDYAERIHEQNIQGLINNIKFPAPTGKDTYIVLGLRTSESTNRYMGLLSSGSHLTRRLGDNGCYECRPIYDWEDGDIWKSIHDNKWDYNKAYDTMHRLGIHRDRLRIAPPTLTVAGIDSMLMASRAWPLWFEKVCKRLQGVRLAAQFGKRSISPIRKLNETWEDCFYRTCINEAPEWIAERSKQAVSIVLKNHARHS
ncbi:hypothetical protein EG832_11465, partial [bacterium]|nr:hypothetical protein [bacterium]